MNQQDVQLQQQDNQPNRGGAGGGRSNGNGGRGGGNWVRPNTNRPPPEQCPRCSSWNTKFCYYNNYKVVQRRYLCKDCKRSWTHGGALRNIPIGGNRKSNNILTPSMALPSSAISASFPPPAVFPPLPFQVSHELPPLPTTNLGGANNMLFSGSESGTGYFLPSFGSTIQGGMIQPSTVLPNMALMSYQVPQLNPLNLFTVRDTGGPSSSAGERNLDGGPASVPPPPTAQFEETNTNDEEKDEITQWLELMKNKQA